MRLCHSRMPFIQAYPREAQEMLFDAHDKAFAFYRGACERGIYDNMKTAVDAIFVGKERLFNRRRSTGDRLAPSASSSACPLFHRGLSPKKLAQRITPSHREVNDEAGGPHVPDRVSCQRRQRSLARRRDGARQM